MAKKPEDDGRCKRCGACDKCGASPQPQFIPYPYPAYTHPYRPYPYWSVIPPNQPYYGVGNGGNTTSWTFTSGPDITGGTIS